MFAHGNAIQSQSDCGVGGLSELDQCKAAVLGDIGLDAWVTAFDDVEAVQLQVKELLQAVFGDRRGDVVDEQSF